MAHNINYNEKTGRYSFFSVQQKAWHDLGQTVQDFPTNEEFYTEVFPLKQIIEQL